MICQNGADYPPPALRVSPQLPRLQRGTDLAFHQHNYTAAVQAYTNAIVLNPLYVSAYFNRGTTYSLLNQYDKATADFDNAITLDPQFKQAYFNRGNMYAALEQYDKAIADYTQAISLDSQFQDAYFNRGDIYLT
ncbi:MAG TPA: tetratricopeptide repeat protein [Methylomusa anaerophila]|uniref:tetratricopeptide repeat protein n=1 Tax=Methylomusa anaerophila TaxID=1930071 RepID=UPI000F818DF3|nr:tetratricopeptide repeat protein [Methylomusa anaerophila]HML88850.1 tetratricopeptide repeat protein [Methylomusa anaerophila]